MIGVSFKFVHDLRKHIMANADTSFLDTSGSTGRGNQLGVTRLEVTGKANPHFFKKFPQ